MAQGTPELLYALGGIDPSQPYGTELHNALARVTVSVAIETVCLRLSLNKEIEVYLTRRSLDDTAYPGEWHCPGSVIRPGEEFSDVFSRLEEEEYGCQLLDRKFVADANNCYETRGHLIHKVFLCVREKVELLGIHIEGGWYPVNSLPEKTVECHRKRIIPVAVGAFVADHTDVCL